MSPIAHFMGSWLVATAVADRPRDRRLITLAGVLPDLDGAGMLVDVARHLATGQELNFFYYQKFHHLWLHGWPAALALTGGLTFWALNRQRVALGCLLTFHLHLLCDLLGSRGPTPADLWPICYGEPLLRHPVWFWKSQWRLDGWQNTVIFVLIFGGALQVALRQRRSFVEVFSAKWDSAFVTGLERLRARFRSQAAPPPAD
jgi:inner membrane protein